MMSEWLKQNYSAKGVVDELVINPLKNIRTLRQVPAHEIYTNKYDKSLYDKQNEIILETYRAIRNIRLIFAKYPGNEKIETPDYLRNGEKIVIY